MTYKCKYNKEKECDILNRQLGNCEIDEDEKVGWRCPDYIEVKEVMGNETTK